VYPEALTEMGWTLAWPATNPTASSFGVAGVTFGETAEGPVFEVPAATSSVPEVPENSSTSSATEAAVLTRTVTDVVGWALAAYQISPSEKCPLTNAEVARTQVFPAESVTPVM
jgi:hypothetical protein